MRLILRIRADSLHQWLPFPPESWASHTLFGAGAPPQWRRGRSRAAHIYGRSTFLASVRVPHSSMLRRLLLEKGCQSAATEQREACWAVRQEYGEYSSHEHHSWKLLFDRRVGQLRDVASDRYFVGLEAVGLKAERLPRLDSLSARLALLCGWAIVPVRGFLPARTFFDSLSRRRFPSTTYIRDLNQRDYTPQPDIFHDIFGHIPLYTDFQYRDFVRQIGRLSHSMQTEQQIELLAQVYWFTVEFGLVREMGQTKVYGSGLISSSADCALALSSECERRPFNLKEVLAQPVEYDRLQTVLFEIDSFEQLSSIALELENLL